MSSHKLKADTIFLIPESSSPVNCLSVGLFIHNCQCHKRFTTSSFYYIFTREYEAYGTPRSIGLLTEIEDEPLARFNDLKQPRLTNAKYILMSMIASVLMVNTGQVDKYCRECNCSCQGVYFWTEEPFKPRVNRHKINNFYHWNTIVESYTQIDIIVFWHARWALSSFSTFFQHTVASWLGFSFPNEWKLLWWVVKKLIFPMK